ncbi:MULTISPECIES: SRPBCC domain-containing protein [Exiguobacterium]|uniref:SRPBCC family protein n=1 Tax=Exiguobacterium TaxID=33986 RepID=UPI000877879E|nr:MULTISPECIES: SRPBCC domain-containing protein [Exiguobacterium]TCI36431.1 SRPBCC domain-containing protein [Exiguobacterium sp. SH4S7]TCI48480.1 SRPBCC domain-containing protein [Exiguobacterium sp. SH5S32]TCI55367.1 SRPBCC domain-containing protein [Exiguobacterium sp. SH1S4]TCI63379.1 SRPBCC domain-containing protein [Exiguobacterium sp. SH0S2]TCI75161.1 SRPBCC domain-containing protein [Exiguobacterium sp. SH1S1]
MGTVKSHVEGKTLVVERSFKAPRELVFEAFSSPAHLEAWWGPAGWKTDIRTFEFEPGGTWHYCMTCVDEDQVDYVGMESWGKATFLEIDPHSRIVYLDAFADEAGNVNPDFPVMTITNEFIDIPDGTLLVSRSEFTDDAALKQVVEMGAVEGFSSQLDRLNAIVSR